MKQDASKTVTASSDVSQRPMTLEEARSVLWLRNNHRPMGELLDEGYLDQARLEWAAGKAYDPQLKQAAVVLLNWVKQQKSQQPVPAPAPTAAPAQVLPIVDAGITIEQARATVWPFRPLKGQPMGALIDTQQLRLKDLVYAIENAWDERVRRAAIVLAAVGLSQAVQEPPPPAGPLKVCSGGRSYAERQEHRLLLIQGLVFGIVLAPCVWLVVQSVVRLATSRPERSPAEILASPEGVIALIIVLIIALVVMVGAVWLFMYLFNLLNKQLDKRMDNYRRGQEGEEQVVEALRQNLDGDWTLFRNVVLPGRKQIDIDAILVGPPGVWVLEVKAFSGEYRSFGEHWEYHAGKRWKLYKKSPSRQAQNSAVRLSDFLKADGLKHWVNPAVVWANRESPLSVENPSVAVWTLDRLSEEVGNIWQGQAVPESNRMRIIEKLTRLCQRQSGEVEF
jgi:hypothetical protein